MGQLQAVQQELIDLGYRIIAVSPDRPEKLAPIDAKKKFEYTLLSDSKMTASMAFGIAFRVDAQAMKFYTGLGIDLEEASGETHHLLPVPAVFVVGKSGKIQFEYVNPNYRIRLDPDTLLAAAKAAK